ncbi:MAG: TetR/AcrR family transcriptional regulator [Micrococcales bacterium]|nr:TetR/AcrR family transcriptional regulator [Micrococcales bacterium]
MGRRFETRAALQDAALELFADLGYEGTTTARIARRAGVSEMTLFRHFASKESLLLDDPFDPVMADAVLSRPADEPPMRALAEGIRAAWLGLDTEQVAELRVRLRIAAGATTLSGALERNSVETVTALTAALVARGVSAEGSGIAASAVIAGLSRALMDWAQGEEGGIQDAVYRALDVLGGR